MFNKKIKKNTLFFDEPLTNNKYLLEAINLQVHFKSRKKTFNIVRGIDLKIKPGQIVGVVGESGSGKSVATKSLLDINPGGITTADKLNFSGIDLIKLKDFKLIRGRKISYIPQDPTEALNPTRKIWKQIDDVLIINRKDLENKEDRYKYIIEILSSFGINSSDKKMHLYPHSFSIDMKQRIVIAMAVASKPDLIIADEPTTFLDATCQSSVLALLELARNKYKASIIFISHNISVVSKFCDYIYVMYAGKIIEKGLKKEIFTDPKHPYTWSLISAIPDGKFDEKLYSIPGHPPALDHLPYGDPFAPRNEFALEVDFKKEPPLFKVSKTHSAATWLLHPNSPKINIPENTKSKIDAFRKVLNE